MADKNQFGEINSSSEYEKTMQKAERMWRKTKLEIHYSIYKDSLHAFNVELATARQTFFSNLINSNLNNTPHSFCYCWETDKPPKSDSQWNALWQQMQWVCFLLFKEDQYIKRRLAHLPVIQRSHRFNSNLKKKWLCLFLKQLIAKFWKK